MPIQKIIIGIALLAPPLVLAGCDVSGMKNFDSISSSVQRFIGGNQSAINRAEDAKIAVENLNPVFATEEETTVTDPVAMQIDGLLKKSLVNVFTGEKLVSIQNEGKNSLMLKYIVKRRIDQADGDTLYKNLIDADSRAKDNATPNFSSARNTVEFSVYHDFGGRSYILAAVLDLADQSIWVSVY